MDTFDIESILASYNWLGHQKFSELNAFHPLYRPGREHFTYNQKGGYWPKIEYIKNNPRALLSFCRRYAGANTVCIGINSRPCIKRYQAANGRLYPKASSDADIEEVSNFYLDIDLEKKGTPEGIASLELFLPQVLGYIELMGFNEPTLAFTGNGYHILFAFKPIPVAEVPDLKYRMAHFGSQIAGKFREPLKAIGARIDSTFDLSRMAKVYGTKKPHKGARFSKFYGAERKEDEALRAYLLSLNGELISRGSIQIEIASSLPERFVGFLESDEGIRELWAGTGKTEGDQSRTGYDFALLKECIKLGITDVHELATILILRPAGAVQASGKGSQYVKKTILSALERMVSFNRGAQ